MIVGAVVDGREHAELVLVRHHREHRGPEPGTRPQARDQRLALVVEEVGLGRHERDLARRDDLQRLRGVLGLDDLVAGIDQGASQSASNRRPAVCHENPADRAVAARRECIHA